MNNSANPKDRITKSSFIKRIVVCEAIGFVALGILLWLNEILDLPHYILQADATLVNWRESLLETVFLCLLGFAVIMITIHLLKRIRYLEGFIPICASCKRIRVDDQWKSIESFLSRNTAAQLSHGICPDCAKKFYNE